MLALRKLEWAKDTPRWVTTNTTSKKGLKGRLVVVVTVVGFGLIGEWLLLLLQRLIPLPSTVAYLGQVKGVFIFAVVVVASNINNDYLDTLTLVDFSA